MRPGRIGALVACVAVAVAGCVGATPRADFEEEVRARGGGISGAQFDEVIQRTAEEVAVDDAAQLEVLTLRADAVSRIIVVQARRGDRPEFLDTLTFRSGDLLSVDPVQDADRFDIDARSVRVIDLPLDQAERLIDDAIGRFGDPDTLVSSFSLEQRSDASVIVVDVESPRRSGEVVFALDGSVLEEGQE